MLTILSTILLEYWLTILSPAPYWGQPIFSSAESGDPGHQLYRPGARTWPGRQDHPGRRTARRADGRRRSFDRQRLGALQGLHLLCFRRWKSARRPRHRVPRETNPPELDRDFWRLLLHIALCRTLAHPLQHFLAAWLGCIHRTTLFFAAHYAVLDDCAPAPWRSTAHTIRSNMWPTDRLSGSSADVV